MTRTIDRPAAGGVTSQAFGGDTPTSRLDLALATVLAPGLPLLTSWLYSVTGGALASLIFYYIICGVLLIYWRKGTFDYRRPMRWPWILLGFSVLIPVAIAMINYFELPRSSAPFAGFLLTLLIWVPLNAAVEQFSWFYVFAAWRNYWHTGKARRIGLFIGILLYLLLVGLIHAVFWSRFLPVAGASVWSTVAIILNTLLAAAYLLLYYRSRSMVPVFLVHLLADLQLVIIASYSLLPYL